MGAVVVRRGNERLSLAFMLVLSALLVFPALGQAATLTANDDATGVGPSGATCATPDHTGANSIQAAINDPALNDAGPDTVLVCAGNYNNGGAGTAVIVNRTLTLRGAQAGVDARTRSVPATSESVVDDDSGGIYIDANVDDVTIDGFLVKNATNDVSGAVGMVTPSTGNDQLIVNNIVEDNIFGLYLNNQAGQQTVVRNNLFRNNNAIGPANGSGIYADQGTDDVLIDANRFVDHFNAGILLTATGSITNDDVDITGNRLENTAAGATAGENWNRINLYFTHDALVAGNTITTSDANGVQLTGGNNGIQIIGNRVTGNTFGGGVRIRDDAGVPGAGANNNVTIVGNDLTGNPVGIDIADHGHSGDLVARFNRIAGNTEGLRMDDTEELVLATDNWWGCNTGPGVACDDIVGAGASNVDTNPWLTLGVSASPTTVGPGGSSSITASLAQNNVGATPGGNNFPAGVPISYTATLGTVTSPVATSSPFSNTGFIAGPNPGTASISAILDGQTVSTPVTITAPTVAAQPPRRSRRCGNRKTGDSGPDKLVGTSDGDRLKGKGGDDRLRGRGDEDCLSGGTENDRLNGGSDEDLLKGGAGDDVIKANDGDRDRVRCGFGDDVARVDPEDEVRACEVVK